MDTAQKSAVMARNPEWHYAGEERQFPGTGACQHRQQRFCDQDHPEEDDAGGWMLLAPAFGMPSEHVIVGEWCSKECFEADIEAQSTRPAVEARQ